MTPLRQGILRQSRNKKGRNVFVIFIGKTVMPGRPPGMFVFWCFRGVENRGLFWVNSGPPALWPDRSPALPCSCPPAGLPCACAGLPCASFVWMCREIQGLKLELAV